MFIYDAINKNIHYSHEQSDVYDKIYVILKIQWTISSFNMLRVHDEIIHRYIYKNIGEGKKQMESWHILSDILILLAAAFLMGTIAELLKQNAIVGYLMAGMAVGPYGAKLIRSHEHMELIAEMGVSLLLFSIGLEFSIKRLKNLGPVPAWTGILQVLITAGIAGSIAVLLGVNWRLAVFLGFMVSMSSTASVLRLLSDRAELDSIYGRNALGVLLLQDIAVLPLTILLAMLAGQGTFSVPTWEALKKGLLIAGGIACFYFLFAQWIPRILERRPWGTNRELPMLLAIVMAVGAATAAHAVGISPAMGAFAAGLLIAGSPFATQVRADVGAIRTTLVTLFFVSVGMLGDPAFVVKYWPLVFSAALVVMIGKAVVLFGITKVLGVSMGMAVATGICLAQVGEFSFVLAELGRGTIIDDHFFRLFVAVTILTLVFTPYLIAWAPRVAAFSERWLARKGHIPLDMPVPGIVDRILIIGFGPSGKRVAESLLKKHKEKIEVIDSNPSNALKAEQFGLHIHIGDATQSDVLEHAGIHHSKFIVITIPDTKTARHIIELCRSLNPAAEIVVRARYHIHSNELKSAGANVIIDEEDQVGREIYDYITAKI